MISRLTWLAKFFAISPAEGAQTIIYLASSPEVADVTGKYFYKCRSITPSAAGVGRSCGFGIVAAQCGFGRYAKGIAHALATIGRGQPKQRFQSVPRRLLLPAGSAY